jgi:hypothetical protein
LLVDDEGKSGAVAIAAPKRIYLSSQARGDECYIVHDVHVGEYNSCTGYSSTQATSEIELADPASTDDDSALTAAAVKAKILRVYLPSLTGCHDRELQLEPWAHADIAVELQVGGRGKVTKATVVGPGGRLDECVAKLLKKWHFGDLVGDDATIDNTFTIPISFRSDVEPPPPPETADPRMLVSVGESTIVVFSMTGTEGTEQTPLLTLAVTDESFDAASLTSTLSNVLSRLPEDLRTGDPLPLLVSFYPDASVQMVAHVLVAVTRSSYGQRTFADPTFVTF